MTRTTPIASLTVTAADGSTHPVWTHSNPGCSVPVWWVSLPAGSVATLNYRCGRRERIIVGERGEMYDA